MSFEPPTIAQAIEVIVRHHDGITQSKLAEAIFGPPGDHSRVNQDCDWLINMGYIKRDDSRPARYFKGRPGPSEPKKSN